MMSELPHYRPIPKRSFHGVSVFSGQGEEKMKKDFLAFEDLDSTVWDREEFGFVVMSAVCRCGVRNSIGR